MGSIQDESEQSPQDVAGRIEDAATEPVEAAEAEPGEDNIDLVEAALAEAAEPGEVDVDSVESALEGAVGMLDEITEEEPTSADSPAEPAPESVAEDLTHAGDEAAAITSALEEVTAEMDAIGNSIEESEGADPGLREELGRIKGNLVSGLEQAVGLLDRIDQTHQDAEARLAQAAAFQQAAEAAQEASHRLAVAQSEAIQAKTVYDRAQHQLDETRAAWEAAQQAATQAACHAQPAQLATSEA